MPSSHGAVSSLAFLQGRASSSTDPSDDARPRRSLEVPMARAVVWIERCDRIRRDKAPGRRYTGEAVVPASSGITPSDAQFDSFRS
jgi:hypothetical protein